MSVLAFTLSGEPRGKGRPRATTRRVGSSVVASVYTDAKTKRYEDSVRAVAGAAMAGRAPLEGPLSVSLRFRMPIPKSAPKKARAAMAAGEVAHTGRPDLDNMAKAILDALNAVAWIDDAQVVRSFLTKIYAEKAGVDIRIEAFSPQGEGQ